VLIGLAGWRQSATAFVFPAHFFRSDADGRFRGRS
jgi:hypothetical protein